MKKTYFLFFFCFLMFFSPLLVVAQPSNINLTVTTDKQNYYGYAPITINGILQSADLSLNDGLVAIQVQDSNGKTMVIRTLKTGTSNLASQPIQITSAYLSDASKNPQDATDAGKLAYFTVNLSNNDNITRNMIVTINLYDDSGIPIGQISQPCSLLKGKSNPAVVGIPIPTWAHSGLVYGYANVYTDWPNNGGVPIGLEQPFQFTLTTGTTNGRNISSNNGVQGTYSLTFRLPAMGPANADYTVYVSTIYSGMAATKSVYFTCQFGDYNNDGTVDYRDVFAFVDSYIKCTCNLDYIHLCDMNQDQKMDSDDFFMFVNSYVSYWSMC